MRIGTRARRKHDRLTNVLLGALPANRTPIVHYAGAERCAIAQDPATDNLTASADEVTCPKCRLFLGGLP